MNSVNEKALEMLTGDWVMIGDSEQSTALLIQKACCHFLLACQLDLQMGDQMLANLSQRVPASKQIIKIFYSHFKIKKENCESKDRQP